MNFNPSLIKTHNGIILAHVIEEQSFLFSQNEKVTIDKRKRHIIQLVLLAVITSGCIILTII